jgi:hypothetical protein
MIDFRKPLTKLIKWAKLEIRKPDFYRRIPFAASVVVVHKQRRLITFQVGCAFGKEHFLNLLNFLPVLSVSLLADLMN